MIFSLIFMLYFNVLRTHKSQLQAAVKEAMQFSTKTCNVIVKIILYSSFVCPDALRSTFKCTFLMK